jgi:hypothetical protein
MKRIIEPLSDSALSKYPIKDVVEGWHFRFHEISNGAYRVEGIDKWGHSVSRTCSDPELDVTLKLCANDVREIDNQLRNKNM